MGALCFVFIGVLSISYYGYVILHRGVNTLKTDSKSDIICTGEEACLRNVFKNSKNLYCLVSNACASWTPTGDYSQMNNITNLWFYAPNSGYYVTVSIVRNNIRCVSYRACNQATFKNVVNNVYALGYEAMRLVDMTNIGNDIIAIGKRVLRRGNLKNIKRLVCIGECSCCNIQIDGFIRILANGTDSLSNSTITSGGSQRVVLIELDGINAGESKFICETGDDCTIICHNFAACAKLNITCNGVCVIQNNSPSPTNIPTTIPSKYPSYFPSIVPTKYPSIPPSYIPTYHPSEDPSHAPSQYPSTAPSAAPSYVPSAGL